MECARCNHKNADGARFCGECGASLTRDATCSGCGHLNPPGQKFCNGCGQGLGASAPAATRDPRAYTPKHLAEKILGTRTALEGERKQVTVLFADVKGSMELAEEAPTAGAADGSTPRLPHAKRLTVCPRHPGDDGRAIA